MQTEGKQEEKQQRVKLKQNTERQKMKEVKKVKHESEGGKKNRNFLFIKKWKEKLWGK